jgi:hypothetical protein
MACVYMYVAGLTIIAYSAGLLQTPPAADLAASAAAQQQLHGSEGAAAGSHSIAGLWAACAVFLGETDALLWVCLIEAPNANHRFLLHYGQP